MTVNALAQEVTVLSAEDSVQLKGATEKLAYERGDFLPIKYKNPKKAALLSAILPGLGQAYNEKYWKIPILYGGAAGIVFFIDFNDNRYQLFRQALFAEIDDDETTINPFPNLNEQGLRRNVDYWRRNRDLLYVVSFVVYVFNIVDANVDAHLSSFDLSDDLSLRFEPTNQTFALNNQNYPAISLKLYFK
ncbi:DUF5683 domain-containing protein [Penaeicola halotolerans]|uniref:DUF5683 domain-containing protein n=1 Tax=Penaeicola halotolerans TaxID=2793196 RepID=UPI001CF8FD26|nr:DUF5683 domain-containing protein [Penaeicola halotolerans]